MQAYVFNLLCKDHSQTSKEKALKRKENAKILFDTTLTQDVSFSCHGHTINRNR